MRCTGSYLPRLQLQQAWSVTRQHCRCCLPCCNCWSPNRPVYFALTAIPFMGCFVCFAAGRVCLPAVRHITVCVAAHLAAAGKRGARCAPAARAAAAQH